MKFSTNIRRAWNRARNPLDVFDAVANIAPSQEADVSPVRILRDILTSRGDRWLAERILAGRLGLSSGLPAAEIEPAPIPVHFVRGRSPERVLVLSGVHGSEPQGMEVARLLVDQLNRLREEGNQPEVNVLVVPVLFPDNARVGTVGRRQGAIPTNRNFPSGGRTLDQAATSPDGQPLDARGRPILSENVLLMKVLEHFRPRQIVSLHGTRYPRRAGIFSDPYRYTTAFPGTEQDAERRTRVDERMAVKAARAVARRTDGLDALRRARRRVEREQAAADDRSPDLDVVSAHPAVAGNRLGTSDTAKWSGEVADGVSLGRYAPAAGIGVFTVETAINRASAHYPVPKLDPDVPATVRRRELRAFTTAVRTTLLHTGRA